MAPAVVALDFDGVICDGRGEYFQTGLAAYRAAWPAPRPLPETPRGLARRFHDLRPLLESGWEFPALIHALAAGVPPGALADRRAWRAAARALLAAAGASPEALGAAVDRARDEWFARDPQGWIARHAFYGGVPEGIERALAAGTRVVVVTTKAERFARALLATRGRRLGALPLIGREPSAPRPKGETLRRLAAEGGLAAGAGLWFVEDLPETLHAVAAVPELSRSRLFLAGWGYNTIEDRAAAGLHPRLRLLSLAAFATPFAAWP